MATAISMYYMSQQIGIALGISITSSLLKQQFQATLQKMLVDVPQYKEVSSVHRSFIALFKERRMSNLSWE
jgi:hypothetical protein